MPAAKEWVDGLSLELMAGTISHFPLLHLILRSTRSCMKDRQGAVVLRNEG